MIKFLGLELMIFSTQRITEAATSTIVLSGGSLIVLAFLLVVALEDHRNGRRLRDRQRTQQ